MKNSRKNFNQPDIESGMTRYETSPFEMKACGTEVEIMFNY